MNTDFFIKVMRSEGVDH